MRERIQNDEQDNQREGSFALKHINVAVTSIDCARPVIVVKRGKRSRLMMPVLTSSSAEYRQPQLQPDAPKEQPHSEEKMNKTESDNKTNESAILEYVKAAATASDRARTVIIVMLVASVFVFTQIRNADGWLDRRIETRVHALRLLDPNFDENKEIETKAPEARGKERALYDRARYFIKDWGLKQGDKVDQGRLENQIKDLIKIRDEQMRLVRLPFFGAAFDANDMGIFAGITFTVVLFWMSLAIKRERRNLQIAFKAAETQGNYQHCYDLLAMQQLLTVLPTSENRYWKYVGYISKLLYLMPFGAYVWLFLHDWDTRSTGEALGWDKMYTLLSLSVVFLVLILYLTRLCLAISFRKDKDWESYTKRVSELS